MKKFKIPPNPKYILTCLIFITIVVSVHSVLLGPKDYGDGHEYTYYNNYLIFKYSHIHLLESKDLYQLSPGEHADYYKYSPTFALFMGLLAYLPDSLGLFFWNLLNVLIIFWSIWYLKIKPDKKLLILLFIILELITSIQNAQSNALITGLIVMGFTFLEDDKPQFASLLIVISMFIKLFGGVAFILFFFYPNKLRNAFYSLGWIFLFAIIPLLVASPLYLISLYKSWIGLLTWDKASSIGLSVDGWFQTWFNIRISTKIILIVGAILLLVPLYKKELYSNYKFKLFYLASILIWVVIFNHKAESPTFILAVSGIAIWYFSQKRKPENLVLLILALVFTVLSPTEVFPSALRNDYVIPYVLKAVPCILIWIKITFDLFVFDSQTNSSDEYFSN